MDGTSDRGDAVIVDEVKADAGNSEDHLQRAGWGEERDKLRFVQAVVGKAFLGSRVGITITNTTVARAEG